MPATTRYATVAEYWSDTASTSVRYLLRMLIIRHEQLQAFRAIARQRLHAKLFFQLGMRSLPIDMALLGQEIDIGLAEAERLHLHSSEDIMLFIDTVLTRLQRFPVDDTGRVTYPGPLARFLENHAVSAGERVRRCAEWLTVRESTHGR